MKALRLAAWLVLGALVGSIAWANTGASNPSVCKLNVCWANQQAKDKFECDSNCYFEDNAVDDSPKAICDVMATPSHENSFPYLYRDTAGLATIGVGNMFPNADAAVRMQQEARNSGDPASGFLIRGEDGQLRQATDQELRDEFDDLAPQSPGCSNATGTSCYPATHWRNSTTLRMDDKFTNELCQRRLGDEFLGRLRSQFRDFDKYPTNVKAALYDLVYNMGSIKESEWPRLIAAIRVQDWDTAAAQSNRKKPISDERNSYVRDLLEAAAEDARVGERRLAQCSLF